MRVRQIEYDAMPEAAEAVIEAIRLAFVGVRRGCITLHEAEVIDEYGSDAQRRKARRSDTEDGWEQVPDEDIEGCPVALCYLDPESWRYYIPAYMIWCLRHPGRSEYLVYNFTIYTFDPDSEDRAVRKEKLERFRLLDEPQSRAVCQFLRYMAVDPHADRKVAEVALSAFWGRFCESHA